jgi:hypothetical protein
MMLVEKQRKTISVPIVTGNIKVKPLMKAPVQRLNVFKTPSALPSTLPLALASALPSALPYSQSSATLSSFNRKPSFSSPATFPSSINKPTKTDILHIQPPVLDSDTALASSDYSLPPLADVKPKVVWTREAITCMLNFIQE